MGLGFWTDEKLVLLRTLFSEGLTAGQIADRIGAESRNAVCGKLSRLGLSRGLSAVPHVKPSADKQSPATTGSYGPIVQKINARKSGPDSKPLPFVCQNAADIIPLHISIYETTDATCKWPLGNNPPFTYCGHQTRAGKPYCPAHSALSFAPPSSRKVVHRSENLERKPFHFGGGRAA